MEDDWRILQDEKDEVVRYFKDKYPLLPKPMDFIRQDYNGMLRAIAKRGCKGETMSIPENLPDPSLDYHEFLVGLMALKEVSNLVHYRDNAKNKKLTVIDVAMKMAQALQDEIVEVSLITTSDDERVNGYHPTDGAKQFWANGVEQGLSPKEIVDGWKAMMSIMKETTSTSE